MGNNTEVLSTKVSPEIRERFEEIADSYGTTPAAALRILTYAFVKAEGFPYSMSGQQEAVTRTSVIPIDQKTFIPALKKMQESMAGCAKGTSLESDDDVVALIREIRYGESA